MGLDSSWMYKTGKDDRGMPTYVPAKDVEIVVGGEALDRDLGWYECFRGKQYNDFIKTMAGHTLYQEEISNKVLLEIADKLDKVKPYLELDGDYYNCCAMFRAYADAGCVLKGEW